MVQITENNRPKCKYCGSPAISYLNSAWVCGNCIVKLTERARKQQDRILLEG